MAQAAATPAPDALRVPAARSAATSAPFPRWKLLAAVAIAGALVNLWLNRKGGYVFDDWLYFALSRAQGHFSSDWLTSVYFQHFAPFHRLSFALQDALPLDYGLVLTIMCAGLGGATYLLGRIGDLLWGERWASVVLQVVFCMNIAWVTAIDWWSASLQMVPAALASLTVIYAYLRWQREPKAKWLWVIGIGLAVGLLFYIRPILTVGYLLLLRVLIFETSIKPRAILDGLRKDLRPLGAVLVPTVLYAGYYLGLHVSDQTGHAFTAHDVFEYLRIAWTKAVGPTLVGVRIQQIDDITGFQQGAIIAAQVLFVGILLWTLIKRRGSWRAWAFTVVVFLVNVLITAVPRLGPFGPGIAYSLRYYTDVAWLLPLGMGLAMVDRSKPPRYTPVMLGAGAVALLAFCTLSIRSEQTMNREWPGTSSDAYTHRLHDAVEKLPKDAVIADQRTPDSVLYKDYPPYNRLSSFLGTLKVPRQVDGALPDASKLYYVENGVPVPGAWQSKGGGPAVAAYRSGALTVRGGDTEVRGNQLCVAADTRPVSMRLVPRTPQEALPSLATRIVATAAVPTILPVTHEPKPNFEQRERTDATVGVSTDAAPRLEWLDTTRATALVLAVPPGAQVCFTDVQLGAVGTR